ncbi:MAG: hypothetical protein HY674_22460 [Chloroflexi bacterium]|nr:hypothetical protein [Chloroflexota bacterium]
MAAKELKERTESFPLLRSLRSLAAMAEFRFMGCSSLFRWFSTQKTRFFLCHGPAKRDQGVSGGFAAAPDRHRGGWQRATVRLAHGLATAFKNDGGWFHGYNSITHRAFV